MDRKKFKALINELNLTKKEKKVAEFLLDEDERVYLMTASEISSKIGVSDSSVIRFIKTLGFKNFKEFRDNGQKKIKTHLDKTNDFIKNVDVLKENSIERVYINKINNDLNFIFNADSLEKLQNIAQNLMDKHNKFIVGFKSSAGLANFFGVRLGFILENIWTFNIDDSVIINSVSNITNKDIIIIFDYPMYSKTAEVIAKIAKKNKATIVIFSDSEISPLTKYATIFYKVKLNGISIFNSLISSQILIEYILIYLSQFIDNSKKSRFIDIRKYLIERL